MIRHTIVQVVFPLRQGHMKALFIIIVSIFFCLSISAQIEICNNSIDDDGDGLIDIQDTDCDCDQILPSGLIPNESFEENDCIPFTETNPSNYPEIECLIDWIQAAPTSDYFHVDGMTFPGWIFPNPIPPSPIPDGKGYLGFRDGRAGTANYKEYVGACLTEAMEVGKVYTLDFFLGFADVGNTSIDMTIYATTECSNLPFTNNTGVGCPSNTPGWEVIDFQFASGNDEWKNIVFELFADKEYTAIILGPGCDANDFQNNPYFYVDRLNLVEKLEEGLPFTAIEGSLCEEEIVLQLDLGDEFGYQWYKDGIAIPGAESNTITLQIDEFNIGVYSVVISTPAGCILSEELDLTLPTLFGEEEATICEGESYIVNGEPVTMAGVYNYTLTSVQGCDSIVTLNLTVLEGSGTSLTPTICEGEEFIINGETLTTSGNYFYSFETADFCDSIVTVVLTVIPDAIRTEFISICDGQPFSFEGTDLNTTGIYPFAYTRANGCDSTFIIDLTVRENYTQNVSATICSGEVYPFDNQILTDAGIYSGDLTSIYGCDSSVVLTLEVAEATFSQNEATICEGEIYDLEGTEYSSPGTYQAVTTNANNCDSTIFLDLEVIIWNDGIELPSDTVVNLGADITIQPVYVAPELLQTIWLDESGETLSTDPTLLLEGVINRQEVKMTATDQYGCMDEDNIVIRINRNVGIYAPNIFSPNGDGSNDYFRPIVNESIASLKEINIYDRWGNLVYQRENIMDLSVWQGWNGKHHGADAITGVYVYISTFLALDDKEEQISGDITLIR